MFNCPYCGARNRDNARFCDKCGKKLAQNEKVSVNIQIVNKPQRTRVNQKDPRVNAEIEQLRSILISTIESFNTQKQAIIRLLDLKQMGYSKAGQVLLNYGRDPLGNPTLQRLATS